MLHIPRPTIGTCCCTHRNLAATTLLHDFVDKVEECDFVCRRRCGQRADNTHVTTTVGTSSKCTSTSQPTCCKGVRQDAANLRKMRLVEQDVRGQSYAPTHTHTHIDPLRTTTPQRQHRQTPPHRRRTHLEYCPESQSYFAVSTGRTSPQTWLPPRFYLNMFPINQNGAVARKITAPYGS